jgi:phosphonate transport system ATP-binding protein
MSLLGTVRSAFQPAKSDVERAMHALELVGLADKRAARADELSGGQQQRLATARVLMQSPDVILADEPTASLDPELAESVTALLTSLARDGRKTLVMAVHKVDLARRHFPRVLGMRSGSLFFDVAPSELHSDLLGTLYAQHDRGHRYSDGDHLQYQLRCAR